MNLNIDFFINVTNSFMKNILLYIFSSVIFFKFINKNTNIVSKLTIVSTSVLLSIVYYFVKVNFDIVFAIMTTYLFQVGILKIITRLRISSISIGVIISMSLSYILFIIAITLEFVVQRMFSIHDILVNAILSMLIFVVESCFVYRIRRLKNGLAFLQKTDDYVDIILVNISIFVFVIYGLMGSNYEAVVARIYFYFAILGICMLITIQKIIVMYYKQKLVNDTINQYKEELQQKDDEIKKLTEEAFRVSKINHEFYNRQKSLELAVKSITAKSNAEAGEEADIVNRIHKITQEHHKKMDELKKTDTLPKTEIKEIDDMFTYMQSECRKDKINFKLKINGNMHYLVNNIIDKSKLETLIGDHLRDAIIAINSSSNTNKELFVILGIKNDIYELSIYDTGIEFEIDTLLKLGLEPATTHKESGGTGIGFMTTFETLNETKASLIIEEIKPENSFNYTKSVTIRFDGKCEYRIKSYRAQEIKKYKESKRIKVAND